MRIFKLLGEFRALSGGTLMASLRTGSRQVLRLSHGMIKLLNPCSVILCFFFRQYTSLVKCLTQSSNINGYWCFKCKKKCRLEKKFRIFFPSLHFSLITFNIISVAAFHTSVLLAIFKRKSGKNREPWEGIQRYTSITSIEGRDIANLCG